MAFPGVRSSRKPSGREKRLIRGRDRNRARGYHAGMSEPAFTPSPDQIRDAAAGIRSTWTEHEHVQRWNLARTAGRTLEPSPRVNIREYSTHYADGVLVVST
jgi:hypothetical protein